MKINFSTNGTLEDHFLQVVAANNEFERQLFYLKMSNDAYKSRLARESKAASSKIKELYAKNRKLKHSIHKAYNKYVAPVKKKQFEDNLAYALNKRWESQGAGIPPKEVPINNTYSAIGKVIALDVVLSPEDKIGLKSPEKQKTNANGAGVYQVTLKKSCYFAICDWIKGCHAGYRFTYKGKPHEIETEVFHFNAVSREEALKAINMNEVESFSFIRELTTFEKQKLQNTRSYNK